MTIYYISGKTIPGVETSTTAEQLNETIQGADEGIRRAPTPQALLTGETPTEAMGKFFSMFPEVNKWNIDRVPTFQVSTLETKFASYLNRPLTDKETDEANTVSAGLTWDPEEYDRREQARTDVSAMLNALLASGELPEGFNPASDESSAS